VLAVEGATVRFDGRAVLDGVDVHVADGETVAVLGPSGCGKTTLLRVVTGLQTLDAGSVTWDGLDLASTPPHERRFGLVFQEYALFPHRNVAGNVEFGLRMVGESSAARAARVDEVLDLVGLAAFRDRRVAALSGGEQQRVALARALAVSPRLLMLDEPLGALDRSWRERLLGEIRNLLDSQRLSALYVTHDHSEAFAIASRVVVMRAGRVVQQGTPNDVWAHPVDVATAQFLGFGPTAEGDVREAVVRTPWGSFPAPAGTVPGHIDLILRPDALRIDSGGVVHATVTRVTLRATDVEVTAAPAAGPPLTFGVTHRDAPRIGEEISLRIEPDAVLVYPRTAN
jgi:thiamine transport system ATP-binding protein